MIRYLDHMIAISCSNSKQELEPEAVLEIERKRRVHEAWDQKLQDEAAQECAEQCQVQ